MKTERPPERGRRARAGAAAAMAKRWLYRLPLRAERFGRGFERLATRALGVEWIVVETVGRRSGRPHTVVLDIVGRDAARDVYYVQPADGRRADWVRNAMAHPAVEARIGARRVRARVRDATGAEGAEIVLRFIRAHPRYARIIVWFVGYAARLDRPDEALRRDLETTPVFALEVEAQPPCAEAG